MGFSTSVLLEISVLFFVLFFGTLLIGIPIKLGYQKHYIYFFLSFAITFAVIAFFITGKPGWDLNIHYKVIDMFRSGELPNGKSNNLEYYQLPVIKLLFYIVAQLPVNNYLQSIVIVITYSILAFIISFFAKQLKIESQHLGIFLLVHFALCSFSYTISGIRNVMAFAFVSAALIRDLWCGRHGILTLLIYVVALCIHPACLLVIMLRIASAIFSRMRALKYILLFWTGLTVLILKLGEYLSFIPFIDMLCRKLEMYSQYGFVGFFSNIKYNFFRVFILFLLLSLANKVARFHKEGKNQDRYIKFWQNLLYFTLGSLPIYHIFDRFLILAAWTGLPIIFYYHPTITAYRIPKKYILLVLPSILLICMNFYGLYIFSEFCK